MASIKIAGIKVPIFENSRTGLVFPSNLVETETTKKNLQNILYPLLEGIPILLVGDAGVGKNALVYHINYLRKHPTLRYSFNEDTLPEDLIGSYRLKMSGQGFEWINGPIVNALENGYTFVADEMNLCAPNVIKRFTTVYESNYLDLIEGDGARKQGKEGFHFISTQNPAEGFEGRKSLPFDITKNFAVIYIDNYPPEEIYEILKTLYPELTESLIRTCIRITLETEKKIVMGSLGKGDLEKYHFNIRTLKKICNRLNEYNSNDKEIVYRELQNIFIEPFRKIEDREEQKELLQKELQLKSKDIAGEVKIFVDSNTLYCNDKSIGIKNPEEVKKYLTKFPMSKKILEFVEKIITSIQMGENILIEFAEEDDPMFLLPLLNHLSGLNVEYVNLCKGIHTSDILGGLKPGLNNKVEWIDGPLTRGIKSASTIVITSLEAAGAELVEKLNMLTDDARSITLPPESGYSEPLALKEESRVFAMKMFRKTKSVSTISRAFRNRFTAYIYPVLEEGESLKEILSFYLPEGELVNLMIQFHLKIKDISHKRVIGSANLAPYAFGLSNIIKWKDYIINNNSPDTSEIVKRGVKIHYINQISDPKERADIFRMFEAFINKEPLPSSLYEKIEEKKKTHVISSALEKNRWWDPELHKRDANTGKASLKNSGNPLKKGIEIDTPETGGNTKEGADAWYGSETRGNMGQGEPAGGGGAWGYRTEELYKQFLAKRKILWAYSLSVTVQEFKDVFGKELDDIEMNLEKLFDPEIDITRMYQSNGRRIDTRKYISFLNGKGDTKVFDKTIIDKKIEKLKGVEVVFLVSKARRIFNFEYSVATLAALMSSAIILNEHNVKFSVYTYSDRLNRKDKIDLINIKGMEEDYDSKKEEDMFNFLISDWQGDSVQEYLLLEDTEKYFSNEAQTKIIVMISDFRGYRGKMYLEDEINSFENRKLKESIIKNTNKSYIFFGVGLGNRYIAENIFHDHIQITSENFSHMPNLIGSELSRLILVNHSLRS